MDDATQSKLLQAILAPVLQPQAQLGLTQQETQTSGQSAATSAQEQQNLQAQNPGIQAQATTSQVQATQNLAGLAAGKAIQQGMDLQSALKKYVPLGANADDIFNKYLSTGKFPTESLTQLKNLDVSDKALGSVGDLSSFADRQNMRNAVEELRSLQDTFNNTSTFAKLPFGNQFGSGKIYNGQRQLVGQHLSSLIQGAPHAAGSSEDLMSSIPDAGDISELQPNEAKQQFTKAEQTLLQSKGYKYSDLGLVPPSNIQSQAVVKQRPNMKGGHLLQNIINDATGDVKSAVNTGSEYLNKILSGENPSTATGDIAVEQGKNLIGQLANLTGIQEKNGRLQENPSEIINQITQHPLNTALLGLPFLKGEGGLPTEETPPATKTTEASTQATAPNVKTSSFADYINPNNAIKQGGQAMSKSADFATQQGVKISGDDVMTKVNNWASNARKTYPGATNAINQAVDNLSSEYKGKSFSPNELADVYKGKPRVHTNAGDVKSGIANFINNGINNAISDSIGEKTPGWEEGQARYARGKNLQQSGIRKAAKTTGVLGLSALLGQAGYHELGKIFEGL